MEKRKAVDFILSRLYGGFSLKDGKKVSFICSAQADEGYAHEVKIITSEKIIRRGGSLKWDRSGSWWSHSRSSPNKMTLEFEEPSPEFNNDGEAVIVRENDDLFLVVKKDKEDYHLPYPLRIIGGKVDGCEVIHISRISSILEMWAETSSGWYIELYPHRPPNGTTQWGDWVGLLHRSDGAVTPIIRGDEFPF